MTIPWFEKESGEMAALWARGVMFRELSVCNSASEGLMRNRCRSLTLNGAELFSTNASFAARKIFEGGGTV